MRQTCKSCCDAPAQEPLGLGWTPPSITGNACRPWAPKIISPHENMPCSQHPHDKVRTQFLRDKPSHTTSTAEGTRLIGRRREHALAYAECFPCKRRISLHFDVGVLVNKALLDLVSDLRIHQRLTNASISTCTMYWERSRVASRTVIYSNASASRCCVEATQSSPNHLPPSPTFVHQLCASFDRAAREPCQALPEGVIRLGAHDLNQSLAANRKLSILFHLSIVELAALARFCDDTLDLWSASCRF